MELRFNYVMICPTIAQAKAVAPGAVIRNCHDCKDTVWYCPMGDPYWGQGHVEFECMECYVRAYDREERPIPEFAEHTKKHLRSLGMSDRDIEEVVFLFTLQLIGGRRTSIEH